MRPIKTHELSLVVLWLGSCNAEGACLTLKTTGYDLFRGSQADSFMERSPVNNLRAIYSTITVAAVEYIADRSFLIDFLGHDEIFEITDLTGCTGVSDELE